MTASIKYIAYTNLISSFISLISASLVLFHNFRSRRNRLYALHFLSISIWCFFYFFWLQAIDEKNALFLFRISAMSSIFIPVLVYHYVLNLFEIKSKGHSWLLKISYIITALIALSNFTPFYISGVERKLEFSYWPLPGPAYDLYVVFFVLLMSISLYVTWQTFRKADHTLKSKIRWILFAQTLGVLSGSCNFFLWYDIPIKPYFNLGVAIYTVISAFVILDSQFIDVRNVFKRISLIILIYAFLAAVALLILIPASDYLLHHINPLSAVLFTGLALGSVLSLGPALYTAILRKSFWLRTHASTGLAHELKSPLSSIQSATDILLDSFDGNLDSDKNTTLSYLHMIKNNSARLESYVKDLLHVARIQDGEIAMDKKPFNVREIIHSTIDLFKPLAAQKGLKMEANLDGVGVINGDEEKIKQVFSNIIGNAVKFSNHGKIQISTVKQNGALQFSVKDEGCGVDPKNLSKIFDRFFMTTKTSKGSGIGLTIAKAWVEAHGGRIWAESEGEGKGTRVTFTLPA